MFRTSMNSPIILVARRNRNMTKKQIKQQYMCWVLALEKTNGADGTTTVVRMECNRRRHRRRYVAALDLDGGRAVAKIVEQSRRALLKNLIRPLPVQNFKDKRFRRPALPFAGARRHSGWRRLWWQRNNERRQNSWLELIYPLVQPMS